VQEVVSSNLTSPTNLEPPWTDYPVITVYVLRSRLNGRRYVGVSADLARRLVEHQKRGTTVARQLGRFRLTHTEGYPDYIQGRYRKKFLKSGQGREWLDKQFG
jgi:putative endonuclease